jgi:hypothetical protein
MRIDVIEQQLQSLPWPDGIERHVTATGFENGEDRDDELDGPIENHRHQRVG